MLLFTSCGKEEPISVAPETTVTIQFLEVSSFDVEGVIESLPRLLLVGEVTNTTTVTVTVDNTSSAAAGADYTFSTPLVVNIPNGVYDGTAATAIVLNQLAIINDTEEEETETIVFNLTNPTGDAVLGE